MKLFIAADHLGVEVKKELIEYLKSNEIEALEIGIENSELDDYPDFAFKLGRLVRENENSLGILICGNGVGMAIAANKVDGIRCVRAVDSDDAFKGKNHNGANVLALGANLGIEKIKEIVDTFISTKPASLDRYVNRINKIISYENGEYNEL
ncbi:MAG: RpiB/LacA/LacB family sugar-phosphate isomerase [Bacilli bacterium]|nr:RpiB/LacA/LacB family sugar-phosphate isomerase [Bacilli bacterium]